MGLAKDNKVKIIGYAGSEHRANAVVDGGGIAPTIMENHGKILKVMEKPIRMFNIYSDDYGTGFAGNVWDTEGISPNLMTMQGGNREPMVVDWLSNKGVDYVLDAKRGMCTDINAEIVQPLTAKGQNNWAGSFVSPDIDRIERSTEIGGTEPTKILLKNGEEITSEMKEQTKKLRIRKLTPKECWRLMGFKDDEFERAKKVNSDSQLYKQAGNSIVVDVLEAIFKEMM